jgi:hypothetical protein
MSSDIKCLGTKHPVHFFSSTSIRIWAPKIKYLLVDDGDYNNARSAKYTFHINSAEFMFDVFKDLFKTHWKPLSVALSIRREAIVAIKILIVGHFVM